MQPITENEIVEAIKAFEVKLKIEAKQIIKMPMPGGYTRLSLKSMIENYCKEIEPYLSRTHNYLKFQDDLNTMLNEISAYAALLTICINRSINAEAEHDDPFSMPPPSQAEEEATKKSIEEFERDIDLQEQMKTPPVNPGLN